MKTVLFDTNVVLDVLLDREPHVKEASVLFSLVDTGRIQGVLGATTITTVFYLAAKARGTECARQRIRQLLELFSIAPVTERVLVGALNLPFADYEDAVLHEAALTAGANAIVTRNGKDFARATLPILSPRELLAALLAS